MSLPPLPDVFGNYALKDFAEVAAPQAINWWPQTAGWTWLGVIAGLFLGRLIWRASLKWYRNRYRREALTRLQGMAGEEANTQWIASVNKILKLTALVAYPRQRVAQLSGQAWADFLNRECATTPFTAPLMQLLALGPYQQTSMDQSTAAQLLEASGIWVREHYGRYHV